MYPEVEKVLALVMATDGRFRPLCRDARGYAIERGESEGILFAQMLLKCARAYVEYQRRLHGTYSELMGYGHRGQHARNKH